MSSVKVLLSSGSLTSIDQYPVFCPFCHSNVIPTYLCVHHSNLFAICSNTKCNEPFILERDSLGKYISIRPNSIPAKRAFGEIINEISPEFQSIYNQAYCAEQLGLNQICGVGYRKSLEFLIKDYLISDLSDEEKIDNIKRKFLSNCIQDDVVNENIKNVAKRAVWLGNDETHYIRKWADKDVNHLKHLIELTIRWIENEVETKRIIEEMG